MFLHRISKEPGISQPLIDARMKRFNVLVKGKITNVKTKEKRNQEKAMERRLVSKLEIQQVDIKPDVFYE